MTEPRPGFWSLDELRSGAGGRWLVPPDADVAAAGSTAGVGTDGREDLAGRTFVAIEGARFDGHDHLEQARASGAIAAIVHRRPDPASPPPDGLALILVPDTRRALARLAGAWRERLRAIRVVAITGSAGKTTTKRLVASILRERMSVSVAPRSFNNDLGVPLSILAARPSDRALVLELGMNRPGEIAPLARLARPHVAAITTIGTAHIEALGSREAIAAEKAQILLGLQDDGVAVVPATEPLLEPYLRELGTGGRRIDVGGADDDADLRLTARAPLAAGGQRIEVNGRLALELPLPGPHNAVNALVAVAIARRLGCTDDEIARGLAAAAGEPLRWEERESAGVSFVLDCWNASPEATASALATFAESPASDVDAASPPARANARRVVVLGEMLELGGHGPDLHAEVGRRLAALDRDHGFDLVVLVGRGARALAAEDASTPCARLALDGVRVRHLETASDAALDEIASLLRPGDRVLVKGSRGLALERLVDRWNETGGRRPAATIEVEAAGGATATGSAAGRTGSTRRRGPERAGT